MKDRLRTLKNPEALKKKLSVAIEDANSLDEIKTRCLSLEFVTSVELAQYLLKSNPPQREIKLTMKAQDGSALEMIVNFYELGDGDYQFHDLRQQ